jgi:hypothetical protein
MPKLAEKEFSGCSGSTTMNRPKAWIGYHSHTHIPGSFAERFIFSRVPVSGEAPDLFKKGSLHDEVGGSKITDLALNRGLQSKAVVGPVVRMRILCTGSGNDALAALHRSQNAPDILLPLSRQGHVSINEYQNPSAGYSSAAVPEVPQRDLRMAYHLRSMDGRNLPCAVVRTMVRNNDFSRQACGDEPLDITKRLTDVFLLIQARDHE